MLGSRHMDVITNIRGRKTKDEKEKTKYYGCDCNRLNSWYCGWIRYACMAVHAIERGEQHLHECSKNDDFSIGIM